MTMGDFAGFSAKHECTKADKWHMNAIIQSQIFHVQSSVLVFT